MSQFTGSSDGASSFFRRIGKEIETAVNRPVPGLVRISKTLTGSSDRAAGGSVSSSGEASKMASKNNAMSVPKVPSTPPPPKHYRLDQFEALLNADNVDMGQLRKLSWNGVPYQYRNAVWQLLLGYLPTNKSRRTNALIRKRQEYADSIPLYFSISDADRSTQEGEILRQIQVDLPRTSPDTPFFQQAPIQRAMERVLYIWAIRHPASGYVQGMNDLLTPLLFISIYPFVPDVLRCDVAALDTDTLMAVEADAYWCLTKLMDNIQDHYTFSQPGLQRMVLRLEDLVHRIDNELHQKFESEGLQYMQFSFRWMNCLLLREVPLRAIMRVWDTYLSEEIGGFENFHVYVCAVLLKTYKEKLMTMEFQDILMFLQELPTSSWGEEDVEPILSQAFILSTLFDGSPSHLNN